MKLLADNKKDFSAEVMIQLAIMLEAVYAAEIIAYKVSRTLDTSGFVNSIFQKRKQKFRAGRQKIEGIIKDFEVAFDETFDRIIAKPGEEMMRANHLHLIANDIVQLLLIYHSRGDGDQDKKDQMKRALRNFKPLKDIDLDAIMKYYKFDI